MKLQKYVSGLCAGLLLMGMTMPAAAEEDGNYAYRLLADGTATVVCSQPKLQEAVIPESIDGNTVTALAENCFSGCSELTSVIIPDTVTSIGSMAFYECAAVTELTIPASVTDIQPYAFDTMEGLLTFHVDADNPVYQDIDGVLFSKDGTELIKYPEARTETEYTIPAECTAIADWAFVGSRNLEHIDLQNVQTIGEDAFYYCVALQNVEIPEGVTELQGAVFGYCIAMQYITLPESLLEIGDNCFYSCTELRDVELPKQLKSIGNYAFFHCTSLKRLTLPRSLETVMNHAFGFYYDAEKEAELVQEDCVIYLYKDSIAYTYVKENEISYYLLSDNYKRIYIALITIVMAIIIGLLIAIAVVSKQLKEQRKRTEELKRKVGIR